MFDLFVRPWVGSYVGLWSQLNNVWCLGVRGPFLAISRGNPYPVLLFFVIQTFSWSRGLTDLRFLIRWFPAIKSCRPVHWKSWLAPAGHPWFWLTALNVHPLGEDKACPADSHIHRWQDGAGARPIIPVSHPYSHKVRTSMFDFCMGNTSWIALAFQMSHAIG